MFDRSAEVVKGWVINPADSSSLLPFIAPWLPLPATYLLLTTYYLLFTTYYLLLTTYHLLLTTYYLLLTTYCLPLATCHFLLTPYYSSPPFSGKMKDDPPFVSGKMKDDPSPKYDTQSSSSKWFVKTISTACSKVVSSRQHPHATKDHLHRL